MQSVSIPARISQRASSLLLRSALVAGTLLASACAQSAQMPLRVEPSVNSSVAGTTLRTTGGVVVSASEIASRAGAEVLRAGGNAVDAAVATGLALAVVYPTAGNIGGGGFMVIRFPDGRATTFDFREKNPMAGHPEMFVDSTGAYSRTIQANTHMAVGVPGTVAGFALAQDRYGRIDWRRVVEPSVALAEGGIVLTEGLAGSLASQVRGSMARYPGSVQAFSRNGVAYAGGEVWRQPDLARTLGRIRDQGRDGFYKGETARLIVEEMARGNGIITHQDLVGYEAQERAPVIGSYKGYEVIGMPPPSSGGIAIVEMLNILEGFNLDAMGPGSAAFFHHVTEAQRIAYRDRARHVGDTDFVEVPIERLTSKSYAAEMRATINPTRAGVSKVEDLGADGESPETTHYSVVDKDGMAVSVTYTLEAGYGSKITVTGAGFLLNNEMGDFNGWPGVTTETGQIGTRANLARPEQRMLSSMAPTILARDGELVAVVGSPGGRTIINTVLHIVLNIMEFDMDLAGALAAPRSHHQWLPDRVTIEEQRGDSAVVAQLRAMGHDVRLDGTQGQAHSVMIDRATGAKIGIPDPRSEDAGAAIQ